MQTFASVIETFGGSAVLARAIGEEEGTVRQWKGRESIPAKCWPKIVRAASQAGKRDITYEKLAELAARKTTKPRKRAA